MYPLYQWEIDINQKLLLLLDNNDDYDYDDDGDDDDDGEDCIVITAYIMTHYMYPFIVSMRNETLIKSYYY